MGDNDLNAELDTSQWDKPDPWNFGSNNFHSATLMPDSTPQDQPDETSVVRTTDLNGVGHGSPTPSAFRNSADLFATNAAVQHQNALDDLKKALMAQPNTSPQQGIAAALLAAVPTIGGALIGGAIGRPQLPAGAYGVNMNNVQLGAGAGMAEGAKVGGDAAAQYLKSLDTSPQEKAIALQKAQWEEKQGDTLQQQSDQFNMKDLEVQQANSPAEMKAKATQAGMISTAQQAAKGGEDTVSPGTRAAVAKLLSNQPLTDQDKQNLPNTKDELNLVIAAMKAGNQAENVKNQSGISPKDAMDVVGPALIAKDIKSNLAGFQQALGTNPDLATKAISQLPLGSDAYNYGQALQVDALRLAKKFEGRVSFLTGQAYKDFVSTLTTEPLKATVDRINILANMAEQETQGNIGAIQSVGGKSVGGLGDYATGLKVVPSTHSDKLSAIDAKIKELEAQINGM